MTEGLVVVTGGGGFIGGHLVRALEAEGQSVRAVDQHPVAAPRKLLGDAPDVLVVLMARAPGVGGHLDD